MKRDDPIVHSIASTVGVAIYTTVSASATATVAYLALNQTDGFDRLGWAFLLLLCVVVLAIAFLAGLLLLTLRSVRTRYGLIMALALTLNAIFLALCAAYLSNLSHQS